eukprot:7145239-Pyramimonas_sp.AAC.1
MTGGALMKALRLLPRLGRVNVRERAGHQMSSPLLARLPRSVRAMKMLAVVKGGTARVINHRFGTGLLPNKGQYAIRNMGRCAPGVERGGAGAAPSAP